MTTEGTTTRTVDGGTPPAGWVIRVTRDALDLAAMVERFGQVFRAPVPEGADVGRVVPGQPCFLFSQDRSRVVGIWAVGEVVAPPLELAAGVPLLPGEAALLPLPDPAVARSYVEVELLPLTKPLAVDALAEHRMLARSALLTGGGSDAVDEVLVPLRGAEVRAVETFDFWIDEPSDEQRARLDALLAAEDEILDQL